METNQTLPINRGYIELSGRNLKWIGYLIFVNIIITVLIYYLISENIKLKNPERGFFLKIIVGNYTEGEAAAVKAAALQHRVIAVFELDTRKLRLSIEDALPANKVEPRLVHFSLSLSIYLSLCLSLSLSL